MPFSWHIPHLQRQRDLKRLITSGKFLSNASLASQVPHLMSVQLIWDGKLWSCQDWFHFPSNLWYETLFLCKQMAWRSSHTLMVLSFVSTSSCILFSTVFFDLLVFDIFSFSFLCNSVCFLSKESFSAHEHKNPRGDLFFCTICLKPFK